MLIKRVSSLTSSKSGHPVGVSDSVITVDLPSSAHLNSDEASEFAQPDTFIALIKLERLRSQATISLYSEINAKGVVESANASRHMDKLLETVHFYYRKFVAWKDALPDSLKMKTDRNGTVKGLDRNTASLYLQYYQVSHLYSVVSYIEG